MRARRYAPPLDLDEDDLRVILKWFTDTYGRRPASDAEAVGAFTFNAVTFLLMVEDERERDGRR